MNFLINKDVFLNNLIIVQKALSNRTPNPALQGIFLDVTESEIVMITTNSDISIKLSITDESLKIDEPGSCLIPGKYFIDIIRKLNSANINIMVISDNMLRIIAGKSDITLNLLDVEDYPHLNFNQTSQPITLDSKILKSIIRQTTFACSSIENRPILTGVNIKVLDNKLQAVSTDSFRLSTKKITLDGNYANFNIIVPGKSLDELLRIIENEGKDIELHLDSNKVLFKFSNVLFQSRLLEGNYPETSKLIPVEYPIVLKFMKDDLMVAIDRASLFSNKDGVNTIVKLNLKQDNSVEISSNSPEIGKVLEEVNPIEYHASNTLKIAFSSKFFLDALKTFTSEEIYVKFTGEIRPFVLEADAEPGLVELILPVRTE